MSAPDTFIGFGGDGFPDSAWLSIHWSQALQNGNTVAADALRWMIDTFDKHTVLSTDESLVQVGSYRLFEFTVSLEGAIHYRRWARTAAVHGGSDERIHDELHACEGNFLALTQYAPELAPYGELGRWTATVPDQIPTELVEFVAAYRDTLDGVTEVPEHTAVLRAYSTSLRDLIASTHVDVPTAAGRVHAHKVLLRAR